MRKSSFLMLGGAAGLAGASMLAFNLSALSPKIEAESLAKDLTGKTAPTPADITNKVGSLYVEARLGIATSGHDLITESIAVAMKGASGTTCSPFAHALHSSEASFNLARATNSYLLMKGETPFLEGLKTDWTLKSEQSERNSKYAGVIKSCAALLPKGP